MASPAPEFAIEPSAATVDVRVIDSTTWLSGLPTKRFFEPHIDGFDEFECPSFSFLIEHPSGRKVLFDLAARKDPLNCAPVWIKMMEAGMGKLVVEKDVGEILEEHGVQKSEIEAIIWSHWHFDHVGDPSTFGPDTALVVGPGFKRAMLPGYPANPDSPILESDYAGRELREIDFHNTGTHGQTKKVGRFDAHDYFGDGSFYLLDSPGHAVGHLCGLARVTAGRAKSDGGSVDSYVFMGADAAHHGGEFRPSQWRPLPDAISPHPLQQEAHASPSPCPGALFEHLLPGGDRRRAFLDVAREVEGGGNALDPEEAQRTIGKMQEADAHDRILVVIAHDKTLLPLLDFFPKYVNDFASKDWVEKGRWGFLQDFQTALR